MRPIVALSRRLSPMIGVSQENIQGVLDLPLGSADSVACWQWRGRFTQNSLLPIMHYHGRPMSARRAIREEMTGTPVPKSVRLRQICATPLCVHPYHVVEKLIFDPHGPVRPIEPPADDSIEDCVHAIYSRDPPWSAEELASEFDYPLSLVREALRLIEAGEM